MLKRIITAALGMIVLSSLVSCNDAEIINSSVGNTAVTAADEISPEFSDVTTGSHIDEESSTAQADEGYSSDNADDTLTIQYTATQDEYNSDSLSLSGKWYNEKEDILYDLQPDGVLYVTEHGNSFEQKYEVASTTVIKGIEAETPIGYEGIFIHYYDTGEPDPWAYYYEGNDTLIMTRMRAVSSVDEPDALPDHIELKSTLTYIKQAY